MTNLISGRHSYATTKMGITQEDYIRRIRETLDSVENWRIVFAFKKIGFKPLTVKAVELMKVCMAIHTNGFWITTRLVTYVYDKKILHMNSRLHCFGDKRVLIFAKRSRPYAWKINPLFLNAYPKPSSS